MSNREKIILGIVFLLVVLQSISSFMTARKTTAGPLSNEQEKVKIDPFAGIEVEAKGAIVWDARDNKVLFAKNEDAQLPLASLAKIMTALVALESGKETAVVTKEAISEEGDSGLLVGEKWRAGDLAKFTLTASSNDGASSLAAVWVGAEKAAGNEASFTDKMNSRAKELGLASTYFLNETGLDISQTLSGAYGSAKDISKLFYKTATSYPDVFEATSRDELKISSLDGKIHKVKNTNDGVERIPGVIASKTGFTDLAGGNLVVMLDTGLNHPVVIAVLGSSEEGRFSDVEKLAIAAVRAVPNM